MLYIKKFRWQGILIHHSADPDDYGLDFDNYLDYQVRIKLWSDLGYHGINEEVEGCSINILGRPLTREGAHCPAHGMNFKYLGFCFAGNFHTISGPSDKRIIDAVHRVIIPWMIYFDMPIERIEPHNHYMRTACPGKFFRWGKLIEEIKNGIQH